MPSPSPKTLRESFEEAAGVLKRIENSPPPTDEKQVNLATSLIYDLERQVLRLPEPDVREQWRTQLEGLQEQLQVASGDRGPSSSPSPGGIQPPAQEVVGDIDDLFSGMQLSDHPTTTAPQKPEFVPQPIPGRRYMKIVRNQNGIAAAVPTATATGAGTSTPSPRPLPDDAHDGVGEPHKNNIAATANDNGQQQEEEGEEENRRYKPHQREPLQVVLPDLPPPPPHPQTASHGSSADSTMARGGGGGSDDDDDSDDESITSPENQVETSSFKY